MLRVWAVLALAGCDAVFGLNEIIPSDGRPIEAPPDVPIDVPRCTTMDYTVDADAQMQNNGGTTPDQGHGLEAILNVGASLGSVGLFRFNAPDLSSGGRIMAATFIAPFAPSAKACGTAGACGPCVTLGVSGTFTVAYARSDWNEATVCYNRRDTGQGWDGLGATGAMDRSAVVGSAPYTAPTTLMIPLDPTTAIDWVSGGKLSVVLASGNGVTIVPQKQFALTDMTCNPGQQPVILRMTVCRG